jgi:two-component system response regulator HydG
MSACSASEGLAMLERMPVDIVLTDLRMAGMSGLEFLDELRKVDPDVFVIMMSGYGSVESAVEAMKRGACDFLKKPFRLSDLREKLEQIIGQLALNVNGDRLRKEFDKLGGFSLLVGRSAEMQQGYRVVSRAANNSNPVLLLGETGTAKELLARSIHLATKDNLPFICVDCCSLMPELLERELFGNAKGSFPGALVHHQGLLANPECGTLYLDEIGDLSIEAQTKLVRVLQEKEVRPYGRIKSVPLKARIIVSSSRDLSHAVAAGNFRQDLYFRLSVYVVRLPPLRERRDDIPLLVEHFLRKLSTEYGVTKKSITGDALRALKSLDWPGNLVELETVLERAFTLSGVQPITLSDLSLQASAATSNRRVEDVVPQDSRLAHVERISVLRAVEESGGDKTKAARLLGISRTTLYRKLNEYKLPS